MSLKQVEQNTALCVQCPNCGKLYDVSEPQDTGGVTTVVANVRKAPPECTRCGCPMDQKAALKFADEQAERSEALYGPLAPLKRLRRPPANTMVEEAPVDK